MALLCVTTACCFKGCVSHLGSASRQSEQTQAVWVFVCLSVALLLCQKRLGEIADAYNWSCNRTETVVWAINFLYLSILTAGFPLGFFLTGWWGIIVTCVVLICQVFFLIVCFTRKTSQNGTKKAPKRHIQIAFFLWQTQRYSIQNDKKQ